MENSKTSSTNNNENIKKDNLSIHLSSTREFNNKRKVFVLIEKNCSIDAIESKRFNKTLQLSIVDSINDDQKGVDDRDFYTHPFISPSV